MKLNAHTHKNSHEISSLSLNFNPGERIVAILRCIPIKTKNDTSESFAMNNKKVIKEINYWDLGQVRKKMTALKGRG